MSNITPMHLSRAERRAAPKPARTVRETRTAFVPSKSAQADSEPRLSAPAGGRPTYSSGGGLS
jgi:hypothetical protein